MTPSLPAYAVYARENDDNSGQSLTQVHKMFIKLRDFCNGKNNNSSRTGKWWVTSRAPTTGKQEEETGLDGI